MAIFGRKSIAGIEIDSTEIRAVELGGTAGSPSLLASGRVPLPEGAVKDGKILKTQVVGEALFRLWTEAGIKTREVILGVSNQDVLMRFAFFPKVPPDKLDNMIKFQAQEFLPIPISEVELDYMVLGEVAGERGPMLHVLLVAARRPMLNEFISALDMAQLNAEDIDASNLALMRLLPQADRSKTVAMVNIYGKMAGIMMLSNGIPGLARMAVINTASKGSLVSPAELETFTQSAASSEDGMNQSSLIGELKSSLAYFQNQMHYPTVEKILICGAATREVGLVEKLQNDIGLRIELIDPLRNFAKISSKHFSGREAVDYAICISLALRGLE